MIIFSRYNSHHNHHHHHSFIFETFCPTSQTSNHDCHCHWLFFSSKKELLNTFDDRSLDAIDADLSSCAEASEGRMTELQKFIEERSFAEEHLAPWLR